MRTVTDDLRAATATVLTKIAYYTTNLAMNLDLLAVMVEMKRLQLQEMEKRAKQVRWEVAYSMKNGKSFMGRN